MTKEDIEMKDMLEYLEKLSKAIEDIKELSEKTQEINKTKPQILPGIPEFVDNVMKEQDKKIKAFGFGDYVIVRTYSAGVFAGYIVARNGKEVELRKARRLWYWSGAASLSQLAMEGVKNPEECKFPCEVDVIVLTEAVEIIQVTPEAQKSIADVPVWKA